MTDAASVGLGVADVGLVRREDYPDAGQIEGRIIELG